MTAAPGETYETISLKGMRGTIARRMHESLASMAQLTLDVLAAADGMVRLRERYNRQVAYDDILIGAVARTLRHHPRLNSAIVDQEIRVFRDINVGIAISLPEGLVAPAVAHADRLSLAAIADKRADLVRRALSNALTVDEMTSGTFTVTNLGLYRVDHFTPVANPPQIAILGVGRIARRPWVDADGELSARVTVPLSLTFDHRAVDGAPAAAFLQELCEVVEDAEARLA